MDGKGVDAADATIRKHEAAAPAPFRAQGAVAAEGEIRGDAEDVKQEKLEIARDEVR